MTLDAFTQKVNELASQNDPIRGTAKFVFDEGVVFLDGRNESNAVNNTEAEADCTIKLSLENATKLMNGNMNVMTAFMMGKMKIHGDMGIAMKIAKIIGND